MRAFLGAVCLGCTVLYGSTSRAATIEPIQGDLSVNQGQGFHPINGRVDANVGDSVMASPGGAATVVYDDGCTVSVQPGAVTTIAPLSPCASGSNAQAPPQDNLWLTAGFAVVVAGVAGVVIYEGTKSAPVSP